MAGAFRTVEALRVVLSEARDPAMEEVVRNLERARMTAEDLRGAAFSTYGTSEYYRYTKDPRYRLLTWREFGIERNEMTATLGDRMGRAEDLMEDARAGALRAVDSNGSREDFRVALIRTNNLLVVAVRELNDEDSESEESAQADGA